mmetsp:Transcript_65533/g.183231  ORF Transcript_65533/g.183231 Transcript_65533/m.183231 type:complete len:312 (-) Transcript_65533:349-1284(-)
MAPLPHVTSASPPGATTMLSMLSVSRRHNLSPELAFHTVILVELKVTRRAPWAKALKPFAKSRAREEASPNMRSLAPVAAHQMATHPSNCKAATSAPLFITPRSINQLEWTSSRWRLRDVTLQTTALWSSKLPTTTLSSSGKILAMMVTRALPSSINTSPLVTLHTVATLSRPHVSKRSPEGNTSTMLTALSCKTRPRPTRHLGTSIRTASPDTTPHTMQMPPSRHVTMRSPFGNTRAETTGSSWVNLRNNLPVRVSHITAVPSWLQVSNRSPKGKKLKPMTKLLWPFNTRRAPSGPHNVGEVHSLHEATW